MPLHTVASGPRNLRLAGEATDGVILRRTRERALVTVHERTQHRKALAQRGGHAP
ncbi:protein of unknown function [Streptomyces sp. KY75]|nr:protein of unknown function [Streptomyces sp. KY70]CAD5988339.1 protein of unknown function [Streptomyces sp. KY75]